ncbi:MAG TPA: DUF362 domain-containing protein [Anaerolineaceae bacterium]|nr:DUF362 domain-containing protein [Anaerolineaceae bacterium]
MTRREFLGAVCKGLLALPLSRLFVGRYGKPMTVRAQGLPAAVVAQGTDEDSEEAILRSALAGVGGIERFVKPGMTVVIKPNATWAYPPHTASSSDPEVLRWLIRLVKQAGAGRVIVLDHCSIDPGTGPALSVSGIGQIVKDEDVEGIFPDRNNSPLNLFTKIELTEGRAFQNLGVIQAAVDADVRINLAVAKTHNVTKATMCLKHMMGFLQSPGLLHSDLEQGIADLSTSSSPIRADLHILEALRIRLPYGSYRVCAGPETDVTNPKVVSRRNQIIAGTDPVLIDAYGCMRLFDMLPEELPYLMRAFEAGLGTIDVDAALQDGSLQMIQVGAPVAPSSTSTPVSAVTAEPTQLPPAAVAPTENDATATPRPTATALPIDASSAAIGIHAGGSESCAQVIDPRPVLGPALVPAAMVVAGAGMAAAVLRQRSSDSNTKDGDEKN